MPIKLGSETAPSQEKLQQEFQVLDLAFLGSLLPGIIHNLATPLSGVLGATQLLEKQASSLEELVTGLDTLTSAERSELGVQFDRTKTNVDILARNAKHLADVLQIVVQRINRGNATAREYYSLNELLQTELRFLDANLTFKHKVKKQITLGPDLPAAKSVYSHVASTLDEFVSTTVNLHDFNKGLMEMSFVTGADDHFVTIDVQAPVIAQPGAVPPADPLKSYLERLRSDRWEAYVQTDVSQRSMHLGCPRRNSGS